MSSLRNIRRVSPLLSGLLVLCGCVADHSPRALTKNIVQAPSRTLVTAKEPLPAENVRAQSPDYGPTNEGYTRGPMPAASGDARIAQQPAPYAAPPGYGAPSGYPAAGNSTPYVAPSTYGNPPQYAAPGAPYNGPPGTTVAPPAGAYGGAPPVYANPQGGANPPFSTPYENNVMPGYPPVMGPSILGDRPPPPSNFTPLDVNVAETRTGRFMFGASVNSDAGLMGQITIDERNFDLLNPPRSWDDVLNGTAWRGAGQGFRIEAQPGNRVQRYVVSLTEPYLFDTPISLGVSAFYFQRNYFDYYEDRAGGRVSLGYRLTPDLSLSAALRAEDVRVSNLRVAGVQELDEVLGHTDFFSGRVSLVHDTRDNPFIASEGHYLEAAFEQGFGEFSYPRGEIDWRHYFKVRERPDGSGKHTLALSARLGISGSDTPLFESYYAGGYSSLRGFSFRGASPIDNTVRIGGNFKFLGSAEYFFPLTADDMIKATFFCDYGTVERSVEINDFRVAPGFGLLFNIPALGPAPLAVNFAFPIAYADTDRKQTFSFFFGASR